MEIEDVISSMPDNVVTHILDRLPIQHAVRTCILSRSWRFKWTMLSQLVFDDKFFMYLLETNGESKLGRIVSRLLLHLKGNITKFSLFVDERSYSVLDDSDIAHWILFLSQNGVKDLTICKTIGPPLKLPTHLFSCLELKHLRLFHCCFDPPASFNGFPNLLSFESGLLQFESSKFGEFITKCPLLETLNMCYRRFYLDILIYRHQRQFLDGVFMDIFSLDKVKLVDIAKLANLKTLSLFLCYIDNVRITSILELAGLLPKLEELNLDFVKCKFTEGGVRKSPLTVFPCLNTLTLSKIDLCDGIMLSCAFELIKSSPNLQTLEITATEWDDEPTPASSSPELDYNTMVPLQLRSAVFKKLKGSENEVCLVKYILAGSPFLNRIVINHHWFLMPEEKLMFSRKLLKLHRASPTAEIDLK